MTGHVSEDAHSVEMAVKLAEEAVRTARSLASGDPAEQREAARQAVKAQQEAVHALARLGVLMERAHSVGDAAAEIVRAYERERAA